MKKLISLFLTLVMILCIVSSAFAQEEKVEPVIVVAGYSASQLYMDYGTENEVKVWNDVLVTVPHKFNTSVRLATIAWLSLFFGNPRRSGEIMATLVSEVIEGMRCNPDGTSVYDISVRPNDPETCNYKYLKENGLDEHIFETHWTKDMAEDIGGENIYFLYTDFRMSALDCAEDLKELVNSVYDYTGSKVRIFALSHGGQVTGTYLSLYGTEGKVSKAVMAMPALGGTELAVQALTQQCSLADHDIVAFLETGTGIPFHLSALFKNDDGLKWLDQWVLGAMKGINPIIRYWGSLWDFVPTEFYEDVKKDLLDSEESAKLIEKCDRMHYEIMAKYTENFAACEAAGVKISIVTGMNIKPSLGSKNGRSTDGIIDTHLITGANISYLGETLGDDYVPRYTVCSDRTHNHISPDCTVDATCAYLPENTWFVDGLYHGMYYFQDYALALMNKLLFTDELKDVHSDPAFPQFAVSDSPNLVISGRIYDGVLTITNNRESAVTVLSVEVNGSKAQPIEGKGAGIMKNRQSFNYTIDSDAPDNIEVVIKYLCTGSFEPLGTRTMKLRNYKKV